MAGSGNYPQVRAVWGGGGGRVGGGGANPDMAFNLLTPLLPGLAARGRTPLLEDRPPAKMKFRKKTSAFGTCIQKYVIERYV